jgi:hypothetical protein
MCCEFFAVLGFSDKNCTAAKLESEKLVPARRLVLGGLNSQQTATQKISLMTQERRAIFLKMNPDDQAEVLEMSDSDINAGLWGKGDQILPAGAAAATAAAATVVPVATSATDEQVKRLQKLYEDALSKLNKGHKEAATDSLEGVQTQNQRLQRMNSLLQNSETEMRNRVAALERQIAAGNTTAVTAVTAAAALSPQATANAAARSMAVDVSKCSRQLPRTEAGAFQPTRFDGREQPKLMADKFAVYLCPDGQAGGFYTGRVVVTKQLLCTAVDESTVDAMLQKLLELKDGEDGAALRAVAREYGPDELFASLHGAEAIGLRFYYRGGCTYEATYQLTIPGKYHLHMLHTREEYQGLQEKIVTDLEEKDKDKQQKPQWPPAHFDLPLGTTGVFVQIGGSGVVGKATTDAMLLKATELTAALPLCTLSQYEDGRLVFKGEHAADIFPAGESALVGTAGCVDRPEMDLGMGSCHVVDIRGPDGYRSEWTKDAGLKIQGKGQNEGRDWSLFVNRSQYEWRPYSCRLKRFTATEAASCLSKHKVVVVGDSNQRTLWNQLSSFACGYESLGPGGGESGRECDCGHCATVRNSSNTAMHTSIPVLLLQ